MYRNTFFSIMGTYLSSIMAQTEKIILIFERAINMARIQFFSMIEKEQQLDTTKQALEQEQREMRKWKEEGNNVSGNINYCCHTTKTGCWF